MYLAINREVYFPNLRRDAYRVTSHEDATYNCIAHAAGQCGDWWWPAEQGIEGVTWPQGIPREETLECFSLAFGTLGYVPCESPDLELGFEKICIYVDLDGKPSHTAKQLSSGAWSSKLGEWEDIEHDTLEALEGSPRIGLGYGRVETILKRRRR